MNRNNNYTISINLLGIQGAREVEKNGKKYVLIDLEASRARPHKNGKIYFNIEAIEGRTPSDYGDTHFVKESTTKEEREQQIQLPILGNMKPWMTRVQKMGAGPVREDVAATDGDDEIPF